MPTQGSTTGSEQVSSGAVGTYVQLLTSLGQRMERATRKYGRGMMLIRDGVLYFGVRAVPFAQSSENSNTGAAPTTPASPTQLTLGNGLLSAETLERATVDAAAAGGSSSSGSSGGGAAPAASSEDAAASSHRQFRLTLKGRPDLKPGDVVQFDTPSDELKTQPNVGASLLGGAFAGGILPAMGADSITNPLNLYVTSVTHTQGRATGFVTKVTGVELEDINQPWDARQGQNTALGDGAATAAARIRQVVQDGTQAVHSVDVGEVRSFHVSGDSTSEPPGQTEMLWRGLVDADGLASAGRRLDIQHNPPAPVEGVAYASPFAWGKCGLVLPRYPGTRVVLAHRNGSSEDPIDVGALWASGHGPESQAGDYWLILPAQVDTSKRAQLSDTEPANEYTGKATNDLIDADGNRIIETGELTLRVGRNDLANAGTRPARPSDDGSITIEHHGGATIVMKQDGSVTITAKNITFDAGDGTITLKADSVDVQVQSNMNVH
jgi:hypothetical protein